MVEEDADLATMYSVHDATSSGTRRATIFMWADVSKAELPVQAAKRPIKLSTHSHANSKSAVANAEAMEGKMRALSELRKIHEGKGYNDEQLHVWAFMIAQG